MSNDTMIEEYPDDDKRYAICESSWKEKKAASNFIERRYIYQDVDMEFRYDSDNNTLEGYAARFNVYSEDLGGFKERIKPGAFKKTIKENDIRALFNHDPNYVLGRTKNDTLDLIENNKGLKFRVVLPDTSIAKDLKISIDRGDISQCSFGFQTIKDSWSEDYKKRDLIEAKLFDISPVTFPAYTQTEVKVRNALIEMGIDYNSINLIITKANRNIELSDSDNQILKNTIDILGSFLNIDEPPAEGHSELSEPDYSIQARILLKKYRVSKLTGG